MVAAAPCSAASPSYSIKTIASTASFSSPNALTVTSTLILLTPTRSVLLRQAMNVHAGSPCPYTTTEQLPPQLMPCPILLAQQDITWDNDLQMPAAGGLRASGRCHSPWPSVGVWTVLAPAQVLRGALAAPGPTVE